MSQFQSIEGFNLEVASFGEGANSRIIVFRQPGADGPWEKIGRAVALLIGGESARRELRRFLDSDGEGYGRRRLQDIIPDGISSSTHTNMRKWLGL